MFHLFQLSWLSGKSKCINSADSLVVLLRADIDGLNTYYITSDDGYYREFEGGNVDKVRSEYMNKNSKALFAALDI